MEVPVDPAVLRQQQIEELDRMDREHAAEQAAKAVTVEPEVSNDTPWFEAPAPQVIERLLSSVNGVLARMRQAENRNAYAPIPADTTVRLFRDELKVLPVAKKQELAKQAQKDKSGCC